MAIKKQIKPYRLIGNLNIVNSPDIVYKDSIIFAIFVEKISVMKKLFLIDLFDGHLIFENDGLKVLDAMLLSASLLTSILWDRVINA